MSRSLAEYYGVKVAEAVAKGSSRARYYPDGKDMTVKLLADVESGRLIGGQIVGGEDVTGRVNWITAALLEGVSVATFVEKMENATAPPPPWSAIPLTRRPRSWPGCCGAEGKSV